MYDNDFSYPMGTGNEPNGSEVKSSEAGGAESKSGEANGVMPQVHEARGNQSPGYEPGNLNSAGYEPRNLNSAGYEAGRGMVPDYESLHYGARAAETQASRPETRHIPGPGNQNQKPAKKLGFAKKALVAVSLGIFFGICAGVGFQSVTSATDFIKSGIRQSEANAEAAAQSEDAVEVLGEVTGSRTEDNAEVKSAGIMENTGTVSAVVTDVTQVVKSVMPAVVSVNNIFTESFSFAGQDFSNSSTASGSGIIVGENDSELLIVTNNHVVYENQKLEIQFADGSKAEAQVKGSEPDMDLAIVAVSLDDISPDTLNNIAIATLGDSDSLMVGEPAIAIGNAMGYGQSVTTGVISALDRESTYSTGVAEVSSTFIQTDAAINPGNSGGALLNLKGEVIGINSNKVGGSLIEGMGYAIPISAAKPIIADLMLMQTRSRVDAASQGYLGITGLTVGDEYSEIYNLPKGVYLSQVFPNTAAAEADMREGDIIIALDGEKVVTYEGLQEKLGYYRAGDSVEITMLRGDAMNGYREHVFTVVLGSRDSITMEQ